MLNKKSILFIALASLAVFVFAISANAQKPFKEIGKDNEVNLLTLSNGRYIEYFTYDTLRQIGSVMFNTKTHRVEYFITEDDTNHQHILERAKETSRFMSIDPLASKFPNESPYIFVGNNPISFVDPDGKAVRPTNPDANEAFELHLNSFAQNRFTTKTIFNLEFNENTHTFMSADINALSKKEFMRRAKSEAHVKLKGENLDKAYTTYLAIQSDKVIEVEVWNKTTADNTYQQGTEGTKVVEKIDGYKPEIVNDKIKKLLNDAKPQGNTEEISNDIFESNKYDADDRGRDWVFFKGDAKRSQKGLIIINGSDKTKSERGNIIYNALKKVQQSE